MARIKVLPDTLISQIAAGEVVERPASVVKELLENSIDAGAMHCSVEIEQGGMKLIAVRDNGCGMDSVDARMAFSRHATSKISQFDDLQKIESYGFRGEALAAIASVAIVAMKTRPGGADSGIEIIYKGGKLESENAAGCPAGTEIVVRNLFFNTPARKKFLKSETTEFSHVAAVVSHMALANPEIGFELKHNGKTILQAASAQILETRISDVLGRDFLGEAQKVSFQTSSIHIHGFVGKPGMSLSSKRHQYLFINKRDISDPLVSRAVCDAYGTRLPGRAYPVFVLSIDIDPAEVDVNVHPRKLAVKFLEPNRIYRDVSQAVSQALGGFEAGVLQAPRAGPGVVYRQSSAEFTEAMIGGREQAGIKQGNDIGTRNDIIGQIADSYILVFEEEGLFIIDQHAAHERILYEKFKRQALSAVPVSQKLLAPVTIECALQEAAFLNEALAHLEKLGFEFDRWSGGTFAIQVCPAMLKTENLQKIFREFLDEMIENAQRDGAWSGGGKNSEGKNNVSGSSAGKEILPERILKTLACKAAIKFGMRISHEEQVELLRELSQTPNNATCPHGRPVRVVVTFAELEKRFYRRGV